MFFSSWPRCPWSAGTKLIYHRVLIHSETQAMTRFNLLATTAAIVFAASTLALAPAHAAGTTDPAPVVSPDGKKPDEKPDATKAEGQKPDVKPADVKPDAKPDPGKKSDNQFLDGYKKAYALIYDAQD